MKKMIVGSMIALAAVRVRAQTFNEWFRQDKTALKYLRQQIAALAAYDEVVEDGNGILDDGLKHVASEKDADRVLHENHFAAMGKINPVLQEDPDLAAIERLGDQTGWLAGQIRAIAADKPRQKEFLTAYADGLDRQTAVRLWLAKELVSTGEFFMQDAERWEALHKLFGEMKSMLEDSYDVYRACLIQKGLL